MATDQNGGLQSLLTPKRKLRDADDILKSIEETDLPESVVRLADEYEQLIGIRDRFVWRWIYTLLPKFTLDCVAPDASETVRTQKTILTIFITTLDDIAEHEKDKATFQEARKHAFPRRTPKPEDPAVDTAAIEFVDHVWTEFHEQFSMAHRHSEFCDLFQYDLTQSINAMEYSWLLSECPAMANLTGSYHYSPHNMVMFPYADVDLAYSPTFDTTDLAILRETIWDLQRMARIGNWVSTWERELNQGDYSSGVLSAALDRGVIKPADLAAPNRSAATLIDRIQSAGIEEDLLNEWSNLYTQIQDRNPSAHSVDLNAFIEGMQTVMRYHLATRGIK